MAARKSATPAQQRKAKAAAKKQHEALRREINKHMLQYRKHLDKSFKLLWRAWFHEGEMLQLGRQLSILERTLSKLRN